MSYFHNQNIYLPSSTIEEKFVDLHRALPGNINGGKTPRYPENWEGTLVEGGLVGLFRHDGRQSPIINVSEYSFLNGSPSSEGQMNGPGIAGPFEHAPLACIGATRSVIIKPGLLKPSSCS